MTDGELLERFTSRRDGAAFETMVRRHGPTVWRVCRDLLADAHEAEDAFQATFLVLVRNAETIRDRDSLGRWLYEVAYRVALRARAHAARRRAHERQGVEMAAADPGFDPDRHELAPVLHAELNRLPERFRAPLVLCYMEGHTQEEAAQRLHCPLGTLKGRLTRGRELLRSRLARRGLAVTVALLMIALAEPETSASSSIALDDELIERTTDAGRRIAAGEAPERVVAPRVADLADRVHRALVRGGPGLVAALAMLTLAVVLNWGWLAQARTGAAWLLTSLDPSIAAAPADHCGATEPAASPLGLTSHSTALGQR
jgi:RNA polymerase sigma factor (sigma-70 family)